MLTQGLASSLTHCFLKYMIAAHEKKTGCAGKISCCVSTSDAHVFKHVTDGDVGRAANPRPASGTHGRAREAWESIQPVTPWDAVVPFQPRHTWDTWLAPLTCGRSAA